MGDRVAVLSTRPGRLKGEDTGWGKRPPVLLRVRTVDGGFVDRTGEAWPLPEVEWTAMHLNAGGALGEKPAETEQAVAYDAHGDGVTFSTEPLDRDTELIGPASAKLLVSSTTTDADLFLVVRVFDPAGDEMVFRGAVDPHMPVGQGWLRASHRQLDPDLSRPWRPYHTHDSVQPLILGEVYELDVEIWPIGIVVPKGYRAALTVRGRDYEFAGADDAAALSHPCA
ncbi:MAG: CocE/NonD family hydrolase C-terminal non-catalytic domain-containing protein, partial [Acidimicrobiales bacterium]